MTDRLKQAISKVTEEAQKIPVAAQDEMAARLEAIASDMYWEQLLEDPTLSSVIDDLADEALADLAAGKTKPLSEIFGDNDL